MAGGMGHILFFHSVLSRSWLRAAPSGVVPLKHGGAGSGPQRRQKQYNWFLSKGLLDDAAQSAKLREVGSNHSRPWGLKVSNTPYCPCEP